MRTAPKHRANEDRARESDRSTVPGGPKPAQRDHPASGGRAPWLNLQIGQILHNSRLSNAEVLGATLCSVTLIVWNCAAKGEVNPAAILVFPLFCLACTFAGRWGTRLVSPDAAADYPTVFLFGFLLFNSTLYLLAWISPFPITVNALTLLVLAFLCQGIGPPVPPLLSPPTSGQARAGLWALAISLAAASLWAQDSIIPRSFRHDIVVLRPFVDSYFHTSEIRLFRDAQGIGSLHDIRMADRPVWFYHHASYLSPALISAATFTSAFLTYGSFYVPLGIVLSGLAAYSLIRSLWGSGAGLAALAALLLLPDASHHLVANHFLGYHWLQQVGPAGLYGVAILAVAWLLMFEGCRAGRLGLVVLGMLTAGVSAQYKAHLFVAAAPLIWVYPGLFFQGVRWRWKGGWLILSLSLLFLGVMLGQQIEAVPTLRLDGSALKPFLKYVVHWIDDAPSRFYYGRFTPMSSFLHDIGWGSIILLYSALGLFGVAIPALVLTALIRPRRVEFTDAAFSLAIVLNWLIMSMGLAYDSKSSAHPEELLHRPLVWTYFIVAAWTGGLAYRLFLEPRAKRSPAFRNALIMAMVPLLFVPLFFGIQIQICSQRWGQALAFQECPRGLFECARFIRVHAGQRDIVQDSEADPTLQFSALCERPAYAIAYFDGKPEPTLSQRIAELKAFKAMIDVKSIEQFARERQIRWYLLAPKTKVDWPNSYLTRAAFNWQGYRVFHFAEPKPSEGEQQIQRIEDFNHESHEKHE